MSCLPTKEKRNSRWGKEETNGDTEPLLPWDVGGRKARKQMCAHDHPRMHTHKASHSGTHISTDFAIKLAN